MGMASACAKGVAKSTGCTFDEAWDASYSVVSEMVETGKQLKGTLILGSATWGVPEKESALTAGARFIELNNEISGYIEESDTSVESEILAVMSENTSKSEETEEESAQEQQVEINWDDTAFISNITAFAGYSDERLAHTVDVYRKGLAAASGLTEEEVSEEAFSAVMLGKENADIVSGMLLYREHWAPELERAMAVYASDFMGFAEIFGEYASMAPQVIQDTAAETTVCNEQTEPVDANGSGDFVSLKFWDNDTERLAAKASKLLKDKALYAIGISEIEEYTKKDGDVGFSASGLSIYDLNDGLEEEDSSDSADTGADVSSELEDAFIGGDTATVIMSVKKPEMVTAGSSGSDPNDDYPF